MNAQTLIRTIQAKIHEAHARLDPWFEERNDVLQYVPEDGGWHSAAILEHIMLTNHFLLILISKGSAKAINKARVSVGSFDWENYVLTDAVMDDIGNHKSFRWERPDHMEPRGVMTIQAIRKRINEQFADCLNYLACMKDGEGVLHHTTMTVNGLVKLDVYHYIYFLVLHALRHTTQMEENKNEYLAMKKEASATKEENNALAECTAG